MNMKTFAANLLHVLLPEVHAFLSDSKSRIAGIRIVLALRTDEDPISVDPTPRIEVELDLLTAKERARQRNLDAKASAKLTAKDYREAVEALLQRYANEGLLVPQVGDVCISDSGCIITNLVGYEFEPAVLRTVNGPTPAVQVEGFAPNDAAPRHLVNVSDLSEEELAALPLDDSDEPF